MLHLTTEKLEQDTASRISFPDKKRMAQFSKMVYARDNRVRGVIGFMDGLSLKIECTSDIEKQNAYYNGYQSDTGDLYLYLYCFY